ncbi:MAG: peptide deformylase [Nitrospinaceae bacterium]
MALLKIARLGNPILRQVSKPVDLVELKSPGSEVQTLIEDMIETMHHEGGVGLAAPQVSHSVQLVVLECADNERYPGNPLIPLMVLVNPVITHYSEEQVSRWESCLSLIDFRGLVPRSKEVTVEYFNRQGEKLCLEASEFLAVILQHEIDHLNGIIFIERMEDFTKLAYQEEYETHWMEEELIRA